MYIILGATMCVNGDTPIGVLHLPGDSGRTPHTSRYDSKTGVSGLSLPLGLYLESWRCIYEMKMVIRSARRDTLYKLKMRR
jgi:hypothetical protein